MGSQYEADFTVDLLTVDLEVDSLLNAMHTRTTRPRPESACDSGDIDSNTVQSQHGRAFVHSPTVTLLFPAHHTFDSAVDIKVS